MTERDYFFDKAVPRIIEEPFRVLPTPPA